jgi:DNA polymerase III delta prime subunit
MHAFLIVGSNPEMLEQEISVFITQIGSKRYDFQLQKMDDIKEIARFTRLTLRENSTIVIKNIETASIETQNAFLKTLEEPQHQLSFILTSSASDKVLPTIVSRVEVVELHDIRTVTDEDTKLAREFFEKSTEWKIEITSKIKKREEALEFTEKLIRGGHKLLITNQSFALFVEAAHNTFNALKKNGNVQIQLTNFVVSLDTIS